MFGVISLITMCRNYWYDFSNNSFYVSHAAISLTVVFKILFAMISLVANSLQILFGVIFYVTVFKSSLHFSDHNLWESFRNDFFDNSPRIIRNYLTDNSLQELFGVIFVIIPTLIKNNFVAL